jgi:predicted lipoprotein with Yx(FWY)xxD motif
MNRARVVTPALALVLVAAVVAFFVATSGGSTKTATSNGASPPTVSVAQTSLGPTLVGANGRTLYLFEGDKPNRSTLPAAGFAIWPAFTSAGKPQAGSGTAANEIGTIAGSGQVTYNGHPLYYYVGDQKPGQTTGQGLNQFGALWYVLSPQGNAVVGAPKSTSSSGVGSSGVGSSSAGASGAGASGPGAGQSSTAGGSTYGY